MILMAKFLLGTLVNCPSEVVSQALTPHDSQQARDGRGAVGESCFMLHPSLPASQLALPKVRAA